MYSYRTQKVKVNAAENTKWETAREDRYCFLPKGSLAPLFLCFLASSSSSLDFVVSQNGNPISIRSYQRSFELLLKRLKIEHRGFH